MAVDSAVVGYVTWLCGKRLGSSLLELRSDLVIGWPSGRGNRVVVGSEVFVYVAYVAPVDLWSPRRNRVAVGSG